MADQEKHDLGCNALPATTLVNVNPINLKFLTTIRDMAVESDCTDWFRHVLTVMQG